MGRCRAPTLGNLIEPKHCSATSAMLHQYMPHLSPLSSAQSTIPRYSFSNIYLEYDRRLQNPRVQTNAICSIYRFNIATPNTSKTTMKNPSLSLPAPPVNACGVGPVGLARVESTVKDGWTPPTGAHNGWLRARISRSRMH